LERLLTELFNWKTGKWQKSPQKAQRKENIKNKKITDI
jgi:hypothetical protein